LRKTIPCFIKNKDAGGKGERNKIHSAYTPREKQNQQHHMTFIATGADPDLIKLSDLPGIIS
jgi:hypothetical protein